MISASTIISILAVGTRYLTCCYTSWHKINEYWKILEQILKPISWLVVINKLNTYEAAGFFKEIELLWGDKLIEDTLSHQ